MGLCLRGVVWQRHWSGSCFFLCCGIWSLGPPLQITRMVDDLGLAAEGPSELVELVLARAEVYAIAWLLR
eukprot:5156124-Amphidinium_carterae.2